MLDYNMIISGTHTDKYLTIKAPSEGIYKEKGSKFLSFAYPVDNEEIVHQIHKELKKKHFGANHHCYAFMLGADFKNYRAGDDGEPPNSAGPPILGQIRSKNLTNILIVVARYFGGTKLGVPGLINAYKSAAADVLNNSAIVEKTVNKNFKVTFNYQNMDKVMKIIKEEDLQILRQCFENDCEIDLSVRLLLLDKVIGKLEKFGVISFL